MQVANSYFLRRGDRLKFLKEHGWKGALDPDERRLLEEIKREVQEIKAGIAERPDPQANQQWFTPAEVAHLLGKKPYTVREWCRLGRINAQKRQCGRGIDRGWETSAEEVKRIKEHGLLPLPAKY